VSTTSKVKPAPDPQALVPIDQALIVIEHQFQVVFATNSNGAVQVHDNISVVTARGTFGTKLAKVPD